MLNEYVWVVGFNKIAGDREAFTCCGINNSKFYEELYIGEGYNVKVLTENQVEELIEREKENCREG